MSLDQEIETNNQYLIQSVPKLAAQYLMQDYYVIMSEIEDEPISESIQKQIDIAKSKSLTTGDLVEFNSFVHALNALENYVPETSLRHSLLQLLKEVSQAKNVRSCLIEHDLESNSVSTHFDFLPPADNLRSFRSTISFESMWGVLDTDKWDYISDLFEGIFINDEEFIQEFQYAFKLKSYAIVRDLIQELALSTKDIKNGIANVRFFIGEHDERQFEITPDLIAPTGSSSSQETIP